MRVLSLFDGIACGLEALKRAGIPVTEYHAFEIDKYAIQVAKKNHPEIIHHGEINFMTDFTKFKGFDLLIGGFPCQSYSSAGKRKGLSDARGALIYEVFRALKESQPTNFLLENVKGLLTINNGDVFKFILRELNKAGYAVDFKIINSALVSAQNRERVYILGKRLDACQGSEYTIKLTKEFIKCHI